ncbi:aminotransferase class IV family protein [Luteimonas aestuarii]|nr:aminotransferase class IV family protein [Luteimonas aestuarii]
MAFLDGQPAGADDLRALALSNYGHFTSMQVRARAVRGFDLHLQRLVSATRELFDAALDPARVRAAIIAALDGNGMDDASARVTIYSRAFDHAHPDRPQAVDVLVSLSPPREATDRAAWVRSYPFQRPLPQVKHVGTFPLFQLRRQAKRDGYDDALFVDAKGLVSEGSIWNVGFWDGAQVIWPRADALRGTTEKLLQAGLAEAGVVQRHERVEARALAGFKAAFACNASGVWPISGIDDTALRPDADLMQCLRQALATAPWQPLAGAG